MILKNYYTVYGNGKNLTKGLRTKAIIPLDEQHPFEFKLNTVSFLNSFKKLYFLHVDFPRFKLKLADLKKVIKPNNADCVIVDKTSIERCYNNVRYGSVFQLLDCSNAIISYVIVPNARGFYDDKEILNMVTRCVRNYPPTHPSFVDSVKLLYRNCAIFDYANQGTLSDIEFVINNPNLTYVDISSLNSIIDRASDQLTPEIIDSVYEMLISQDKNIRQLGLKTLASYNILMYKDVWNWIITLAETHNGAGFNFNDVSTKIFKKYRLHGYPLCNSKDEIELYQHIIKKYIPEMITGFCKYQIKQIESCGLKLKLTIE